MVANRNVFLLSVILAMCAGCVGSSGIQSRDLRPACPAQAAYYCEQEFRTRPAKCACVSADDLRRTLLR